jgi:ATP-dependent 26S proteasome regulatory subunit
MNSDVVQWQDNNEQYLSSALAWLRLRLQNLSGETGRSASASATPLPASSVAETGSVFSFANRPQTEPESTKNHTVPTAVSNNLNDAESAMLEAAAADPPPALLILTQRFGLSPFERDVLLLCAAMELDTRIAHLCANAQHNPNQPYPTFALALALFADPAWDVMSPERPLRHWQLIEINQPGAQPLTTSTLRADERIVNYIKGLNYLDDRLTPLLAPFTASPESVSLPPSQETAVAQTSHYLQQPGNNGRLPIVQLVGIDALSKQLVAQQAANRLNLHLYRLPVALLPTQTSELELMARLWERESLLLPIALFLDAHDADGEPQKEGASPLHRFLARSQGIFFLSTREVRQDVGSLAAVVEVDKPTPAEQQSAWRELLGDEATDASGLLAEQFNLNLVTMRQIANTAQLETAETGANLQKQVWQACLLATQPRLDLLAQRIEAKATWNEIVLPQQEEQLLRQIAEQVRQRSTVYDTWGFRQKLSRGLGISALFAGASGTGKTMAAEVIADELNLNLYRIDLSAVVSKYIGETEKNLRRLFDAAEQGGAILFFDEADALFGKRSEVKDSHDRYANIEINYLLQRMEAFRGLAILATNIKSALDHAFMRRLRFIINFPFPGQNEREAIWQRIFPKETPLQDVDFAFLSRIDVTGGSINNIALNAAFLAAQAGTAVSMPLLIAATRAELRKLNKPINEAALRWQEPEASGQ